MENITTLQHTEKANNFNYFSIFTIILPLLILLIKVNDKLSGNYGFITVCKHGIDNTNDRNKRASKYLLGDNAITEDPQYR